MKGQQDHSEIERENKSLNIFLQKKNQKAGVGDTEAQNTEFYIPI